MQKRIEQLRSQLDAEKIDGILITSAANRLYMSGFSGSTGYVLISSKHAALITDFRYIDQAKEECPDYEVVDNKRKMNEALLQKVKEFGIHRLGFEKAHMSYAQYETLSYILQGIELIPTDGLVEELRMIKDEGEIAIIRKAVEIADQTFSHILSFIRPGVREIDIAIEMEFFMRKLGASGPSFDTIVASGVRSALPHGRASDKVIQEGELVTLDFGAVYKGYVSDLTRTVAVGEVSSKLKEIYDICLKAQLAGVEKIRSGMTGKEADAICRDIIAAEGYGEAFGHSTGHGIGLDVHEGPGLSSVSETILKPGMIVTVEPGIYLSGIGGVRIEDDILITDSGNEILSKSTKELLILA
jgi:Xaa-Pro aminopeptidase